MTRHPTWVLGFGDQEVTERVCVYYGCAPGAHLSISDVLRVQVSYDTRARVICIAPLKAKKGPAGADAFRISRNAPSDALIHCTTLHTIMPTGRYRFVEHTSEGYICQHDPAKPAGKR